LQNFPQQKPIAEAPSRQRYGRSATTTELIASSFTAKVRVKKGQNYVAACSRAGIGYTKEPEAYDVLAFISGEIYFPDSFEEFCRDYGYDLDSRKAEIMFRRCNQFAKRRQTFFTPTEQEALAEIM